MLLKLNWIQAMIKCKIHFEDMFFIDKNFLKVIWQRMIYGSHQNKGQKLNKYKMIFVLFQKAIKYWTMSLNNTFSIVQHHMNRYFCPISLIFGVIECFFNIVLFSQKQFRNISCCTCKSFWENLKKTNNLFWFFSM